MYDAGEFFYLTDGGQFFPSAFSSSMISKRQEVKKVKNIKKEIEMSNNAVLVIGQSGSGKSTSIRNLDPDSTFIINVLDKPMPFRGARKKYTSHDIEGRNVNYVATYDWAKVIQYIRAISDRRPDVKTLVIDDWQYIMSFEFMGRVFEKGFDKFSEMGNHGWATLSECLNVRPDLMVFILSHSDFDVHGQAKMKTIGKLLDDKITLEGMFTTILHARVVDGEYMFQTNCDSEYMAKSPMGMFESNLIPNDLLAVKSAIESYYNDEE